MSFKNSSSGLVFGALLIATATFGQNKPDFSGTWELATIERNGNKVTAGTNFKETQIWQHNDPKLTIKMMVWDGFLGYRTVELTYTTNGETGIVGYLTRPDGTKNPVNGSQASYRHKNYRGTQTLAVCLLKVKSQTIKLRES